MVCHVDLNFDQVWLGWDGLSWVELSRIGFGLDWLSWLELSLVELGWVELGVGWFQ